MIREIPKCDISDSPIFNCERFGSSLICLIISEQAMFFLINLSKALNFEKEFLDLLE